MLRAEKLAKIDVLMKARELEDPLAFLPWNGTDVTLLEYQRTELIRRLDADPSWEPPLRWYSDEYGQQNGLPTD